MSAQRSIPIARELLGRSPSAATLEPVLLTTFRRFVGVALSVYFARTCFGITGFWDGSGDFARGETVLAAAAAATASSAAIALGVLPRVCAAILFVSIQGVSTGALRDFTFDERIAAVFALFLILLLPGDRRKPSVSTAAFLAYVAFIYIELGRRVGPGYWAAAIQAVPVVYMLPGRWSKCVAGVLHVTVHGYLIYCGWSLLGNACLCATGLLYFGEIGAHRDDWLVDTGAAVAVAFVAVSAAAFVLYEVTGDGGRPERLLEMMGTPTAAWRRTATVTVP